MFAGALGFLAAVRRDAAGGQMLDALTVMQIEVGELSIK